MIATRRTGWIGADVGTSTVKLAQLEKTSRGLRLAAAAIVPRASCWPCVERWDCDPGSSEAELRVARSLRVGFRGRRLAATLPMSICDAYVLPRFEQGKTPSPTELLGAVETVTQRPADLFRFAIWSTQGTDREALRHTQAVALPTCWADQLCDDVARTGWSCEVLDALPFCLARAVALNEPKSATAPIAVLDWGYRRATWCVVDDGQPAYVRRLKGCGLESLLATLANHLHVDPQEAQRLLLEYGIDSPIEAPDDPAAALVRDLLSEPLARLEAELDKTLAYLATQRSNLVPRKLTLLGGGAIIAGLPERLAKATSLEVSCWDLGGDAPLGTKEGETPGCLFGPAAALSALAWEKS